MWLVLIFPCLSLKYRTQRSPLIKFQKPAMIYSSVKKGWIFLCNNISSLRVVEGSSSKNKQILNCFAQQLSIFQKMQCQSLVRVLFLKATLFNILAYIAFFYDSSAVIILSINFLLVSFSCKSLNSSRLVYMGCGEIMNLRQISCVTYKDFIQTGHISDYFCPIIQIIIQFYFSIVFPKLVQTSLFNFWGLLSYLICKIFRKKRVSRAHFFEIKSIIMWKCLKLLLVLMFGRISFFGLLCSIYISSSMESTQLRNIQSIENSLVLLKSKIEKMSRLDSQNQDVLFRLKESAIPIVQKKMRDTRLHHDSKVKKSIEIKKRNQESRLINEKEVARSKELISLMKHHNSLHIKQTKKTNEEKIHKIKELQLNQKKSKNSLIKQKQKESQAKILEFHQQKRNDLRLRRENEQKENENKIKGLVSKMKQLAKKEMELQQKVKASQENISKVRSVIKKVDKMKTDQFLNFTESISPSGLSNSKSVSEAILQFATRSEGYQKAI